MLASLAVVLLAARRRSNFAAFLGSSAYLATMMVGAVVGLFPVLLPTVGAGGRDITIPLALAGPHTLRVGLVWWTLGILLATMYFVIIHWLFRGKVPRHADGYGH